MLIAGRSLTVRKAQSPLALAMLSLALTAWFPPIYIPTEEAMVILEGEMDAILGDEVITVGVGQTVLAPSGVRHGFVNRSGSPARVLAIFPTANMERTLVD